MLKNRREKLLAGTLAVVGVACFAGDALCNAVLHPFGDREKQLASLNRKVGDQSLIFQRVEHAQRRLKYDVQQSLPPDPSVAGTLYQNWLVELARSHGLNDALVTPNPPQPEKQLGHRMSFSVQTTSTPSQIGGFVDSLQRASLLHRITQFDLSKAVTAGTKDVGNSAGRLKAAITIEALALSAAEPRQQLFSEADASSIDDEADGARDERNTDAFAAADESDDSKTVDDADGDEDADSGDDKEELDDDDSQVLKEVRERKLKASQSVADRIAAQQGLKSRPLTALRDHSAKTSKSLTSPAPARSASKTANDDELAAEREFVSMERLLASTRLFDRYEPPPPLPPKSAKPVVVTPPPDPLTQLQFVATWGSGTAKEAWVFDSFKRHNVVLKVGDELRLLNVRGKVAAIQDDRVTVHLNNEQRDWLLGQSLKTLTQPLGRPR